MSRELIFDQEAREKLKKGIDLLADTLSVTLGPKGRGVGLDKGFGSPTISSDGSTVAREVELKDQYANMAVGIAKDALQKIKEECGDGSTTSIILARALVSEGIKRIAAGASPILLKRGLDKALQATLNGIDTLAIPVETDKELFQLASAAAGGDAEVGKYITEAFRQAGREGVISIKEGKGTETLIVKTEGISFERGYISSYFCNETEPQRALLSYPKVLITDKKISSIHEILPLLQTVAASGSSLLIIAEDIEGDALSALAINCLRGALKIAAVKAPSFGNERKALLEDLAILTGATVVSEEKGMQLKETGIEVLGSAESIVVTKEETTIIGAQGTPTSIQERVKSLDAQIKESASGYEREKLELRKGKLSGGVALIRVGGCTETEMKEKKHRFENSLNATKSAFDGGVVPGGATAYLTAREPLTALKLSEEEKEGAELLYKALEAPFRTLLQNAGYEPATHLAEVTAVIGFNVETGERENLIESGIIDPVKTVKTALIYAVSLAGTLLLCETLIGNVETE